MQFPQPKQEQYLPRLRQDLQLNPGPQDEDGSPTWTLYDPAANKYYKIGWLEFECIARFTRCTTATELIGLVSRETTLHPDEDTIKSLLFFLMGQHLVQAASPDFVGYLDKELTKKQLPLWKQALHSYLYFTIPLFKPQKFLEATLPIVRPFLSKPFITGVMLLLAYDLFLTSQRMDEFSSTFMTYVSGEGVAYILVTLFFMKFIHELGHAYTATKYGVPVSTLGVAMMVMYPVMYTETSNAWRMESRRERIHIAIAGVLAEMTVASVALLMWHILPPGIGRSIAFIVAAVSLVGSLVVNLNPLMRFDGYYIFADLVGIDNLQERACNFAKWRLRRVLWGWDDPKPEIASPERQHVLEVFGFSLLTYRFVLYSGISVMVYHIFFKPMGLILMGVEVGWFLAMPIFREMMVWWKQKSRIIRSWRGGLIGAALAGGLVFCILPAQDSVEVPAVMHSHDYTRIFPPAAGQITEIDVTAGQHVRAGDVLFRVSSPMLEHQITAVQLKLESLREIKGHQQANLALSEKWLTRDVDITSAEKELEGLTTQQDQLVIKAGYDGIVQDVNRDLHSGQWISSTTFLALLTDTGAPILSGYVDEQDHGRISNGAAGYFYPEFSPLVRYPVTVTQIETTDTSDIFWPELASVFGGPLPADQSPKKVLPVSRYTLYGVNFNISATGANIALPSFAARGVVRLDAAPERMVKILIRRALSIFQQESGL